GVVRLRLPPDHARPLARRLRAGGVQGRGAAPRPEGERRAPARARLVTTSTRARTRTTPFRFYDNRQKYLAFVTTCNEKAVVAARASEVVRGVRPSPPALRLFDAGMGDGTVLVRLVRNVHRFFPTVPWLAVAKEISLEDVRLGLEKMPDRFYEHPATVLVITNLSYADAPALTPSDPASAHSLNWHEARLSGTSAAE